MEHPIFGKAADTTMYIRGSASATARAGWLITAWRGPSQPIRHRTARRHGPRTNIVIVARRGAGIIETLPMAYHQSAGAVCQRKNTGYSLRREMARIFWYGGGTAAVSPESEDLTLPARVFVPPPPSCVVQCGVGRPSVHFGGRASAQVRTVAPDA